MLLILSCLQYFNRERFFFCSSTFENGQRLFCVLIQSSFEDRWDDVVSVLGLTENPNSSLFIDDYNQPDLRAEPVVNNNLSLALIQPAADEQSQSGEIANNLSLNANPNRCFSWLFL